MGDFDLSSFTKHYNKKTGAVYLYSVESYWDKEKKAPRTKQVYLGRLDDITGELIPSRPKSKEPVLPDGVCVTSQIWGPPMLLDKLDADLGVSKLLNKCFPQVSSEIMSLVYFLVQKGLPLSRSELWSSSHKHPFNKEITSQRISELLVKLAEGDRQRFLSLWAAKMAEHEYLCYDITSISSYSKGNEYVRWGYNRDNESLPQINLAMLFGQNSRLPAGYRRLQGNISDVSTLKTTLKTLDYLGIEKAQFIFDRGFYSIANVDELFERHHRFILAVPPGRKWVENILDNHYESTASPKHYYQTDSEEALYAVAQLHSWGDSKRRCYLHLYYNATRAAEDFDKLTRTLIRCKQDLESNQLVDSRKELYDRFFLVQETPKRGRKVEYNDSEIQRYRKRYAGFFCILSSHLKDPVEVLSLYRAKDVVENCFDDLKNHLDMSRLRIHSSAAMDSRLFIQFLALIFICKIRSILQVQTDSAIKWLTVRETMEAMEPLVKLTFSARYGQVFSELNPLQHKIMLAFGLSLPSA
jgi:transposase